jgi:ferric-dicitrate binding protein FerR (iron transport regulator)
MSDALKRVLSEARLAWGNKEHRRLNWEAIESGLFARIEDEQRRERRELAPTARRGWGAVAVALATVAVVLVAGQMRESAPFDREHAVVEESAGTVMAVEGSGDAIVDGKRAEIGATLRVGSSLETKGAQLTVGRAGKLTFVLERGSIAQVVQARGALVLSLFAGAVEAQVAPVAGGEAFGVDVGPSRVAVHGTHLRVARTGARVAVDLTDGVVSVGSAPRIGPTVGSIVTAPAHAEFAEADAQGTLLVSHDASRVRAAVLLGRANDTRPAAAVAPSPATASRADAAGPPPPAYTARSIEPRGDAGAPASLPSPSPDAEELIMAAVQACMSERLHADDVTILLSTTLYLDLRDDGMVRSARFDPPVAPDVNACAAQSIYKARFTHGGPTAIAISVKN